MNKQILVLTAVFFLLFSCHSSKNKTKTQPKTIGNITLSEGTPQPGDTLIINYNNIDTAQTGKDFGAFYYVAVGKNIYGYDLPMDKADSSWKGTLKIPDSATALAFSFRLHDGKLDNNDEKGYFQLLYTNNNKILPESRASIAFMQATISRDLGTKPQLNLILNNLKEDLADNPSLDGNWGEMYVNYLMYKDTLECQKVALQQTKKYGSKKNKSGKEFELLVNAYRLLEDNKKMDSVKAIAIQKFPKGTIVEGKFLTQFEQAKNSADKEKIYQSYTDKIGSKGKYNDRMLTVLANVELKHGDFSAFQTYANQLSKMTNRAFQLNNAAWNLAKTKQNLPAAEEMIKQALHYVDPKFNTDKDEMLPKSMRKRKLIQYSQMFGDTYGLILFKEGKVKEAISAEEKAVGDGESPEVNTRYVQFLLADNDTKRVIQKSEEYIKNRVATKAIKDYYHTAYKKVNGSDKGFAQRFRALENIANKAAIDKLKAEKTNKALPEFALINGKGDTLTPRDFMGKITILDFWATWCGPCKASFPGMKELVNTYKNDKNVQFYFVNTFQREPKKQRMLKVTQFIKQKGYPFNVLYDMNVKNHFGAAESLGIDGIPTKIIIGPDGRWNFTKVGFDGSTNNMVKEVKLIIQLLSNESK